MYENDRSTSDQKPPDDDDYKRDLSNSCILFAKTVRDAEPPPQQKFVLRIKTKQPIPTIPEETPPDASSVNGSPSTSSESVTVSTPSKSTVTTLSFRMENGDPLPRLAPGIYHRKPTPILTADEPFKPGKVGAPSVSSPSVSMRAPPPTWLPPQPPDGQRIEDEGLLSPEEDNYEDPETIQKNFSSRDPLVHPSTFNSYEVSASQLRRSQVHKEFRNSTLQYNAHNVAAPPLDEWPAEGQRVLHKNSEGAYYIPTGSVRTQGSTLSPALNARYEKECSLQSSAVSRLSRVDPPTATLLQHTSTASVKKKSPSMSPYEKGEKDEKSSFRPSMITICLLLALLISLFVIILLLFRSPSYVYSEGLPGSPSSHSSPHLLADLRPLPAVIHLGNRVNADLTPHSFTHTEIYIPRPSRVSLNVSVGSGAQLVLLGRHSVPPSLSLHEIFHPIRADHIPIHPPTHLVETVRKRREAIEIVSPRSTVIEHFMMEGRWHLALLNERNRVEPISIMAETVESMGDGESADTQSGQMLKCESDCSGHGECLNGVCKCSTGYTGIGCEEAICPLICSGNGVFSGGRCVCFEGFKGKECDVKEHWCEVADCNGRGRCSARGVCECVQGWTGDACQTRSCANPTCSGKGICSDGKCYCESGWMGMDCGKKVPEEGKFPEERGETREQKKTIPNNLAVPATVPSPRHPPRMKGRERDTVDNKIDDPQALHGLLAPSIHPSLSSSRELSPSATLSPSTVPPQQTCSGNGHFNRKTASCKCATGFEGDNCEKVSCVPVCLHGVCSSGVCQCEPGWKGGACDEKECALGCESHGRCEKNGTCLCDQGWNGDNCYIMGCPRECSSHGQCRYRTPGEWKCVCDGAHTGVDCSIPVETSCEDGIDNDNDGLVDCEDPECCARSECRTDPSCVTVPSPTDVLLRLPSPVNAHFFQRVMFLIKNDSVQSYSDHGQFNESVASVIRGRVVWDGGVTGTTADQSLPGVRVSDVDHPLFGFTLSRVEGGGAFDLLVNGGRAVRLQFLRNPFQRKKLSIYVPPNEIVYVGDVVMTKEKNSDDPLLTRARVECSPMKRQPADTVVVTDWKSWGAPPVDGQPRLLVDTGTVVDSIPIPGTELHLVYDSSRSEGSGSRLHLQLIGQNVDETLRLVHVKIDVAGRRFSHTLSARPNLTHSFTWDRQNVYKQTENGLVHVNVRIGYEYAGCERDSEIVWIEKRVEMAGRRTRSLPFGGWTMDIHHHYDIVNNILEKGDGARHFLGQQSPTVDVLIGNEKKRDIDCTNCNSPISSASLFRPSSLAVCPDGSTLIGDHNLIRRLTPDGRVITVLVLSLPDTTYQYYLAVNPLRGEVFVSLPLHKQIWKILSLQPIDPTSNHEVFAGDGTTCASASDACGDGGPAADAQLFFPKGLAVDTQGTVYVADGRRVRAISSGTIRSVADHSFHRPPSASCPTERAESRRQRPIGEIQLEWPTSLTVDWHTDSLFVLDANVVYELNPKEETARVLLGTPSTCTSNTSSSAFTLRHARDITVSNRGDVYVLEADGKKVNQIRVFSPLTSSLSLLSGRISPCSCDVSQCVCDTDNGRVPARSALFNSPLAIAVDARGRVLLADTGNAKVKLISGPSASFDPVTRQYSVQWPSHDEVYLFNRHGLHISTRSLLTDRMIYTFNYNVDTHLGRLTQISSPGGLLLRAIWQNETAVSIDSPAGLRSLLSFSPFDASLETVVLPSKESVRLFYQTGGLLKAHSIEGDTVLFGYDTTGRATTIAKGNHVYTVDTPTVHNGYSLVTVLRDGTPYSTFRSRDGVDSVEGSLSATLIELDDDGYELTQADGSKTLYEAESHLLWSTTSVWRSKRTLPALESSSHRELISRFDWRPYVKRANNKKTPSQSSAGRRVAEVGARPRVNGVNVYAFEYDRVRNRDVIRNKNDDELLTIDYAETGEWKAVRAVKEMKVLPLNVSYDALGRRSEIVWGGMRRQWAYDRQNRVTERNEGVNERVYKYGYGREGRQPTTVDVPSGDKYTMKYDNKGRLMQITTPAGEQHFFSSTVTPQGLVVRRKFPFTKKPVTSLLSSSSSNVLEWVPSDETQWIRYQRDSIGRPVEISLNGIPTLLSYDGSTWRVNEIWNNDVIKRITYQAHLPVLIDEMRRHENGYRNSSFSLFYDDLGRLISIQSMIEGVAVEGVQMKWNERTGKKESTDGYAVINQADMQRISGHKTMIESQVDGHGMLMSRKAAAGDTRSSVAVSRDLQGRVLTMEWRRHATQGKEVRGYDVNGRVAEWSTVNGDRWTLKYDRDGRIKSINEISIEYANGGVPRKFGTIDFSTDYNGWTTKRGNATFTMDPMGRLVKAVTPETTVEVKYDELDRPIWIRRGSLEYSLFYAYSDSASLISHFTNSQSGSVSTLFYTEEGHLFAMSSGGYRYAILSDASRTPRSVLTESGSVKDVDYTSTGGVHSDTNRDFWIPVGHLGGIDLPEIGVAIVRSRPLDTLIGRWMSFGPAHSQAPPTLMDPRRAVDVFALSDVDEQSNVPEMPMDLSSWLSLVGITSSHLFPPPTMSLSSLSLLDSPALSLPLSSFPSRLRLFSRMQSISPSLLSDSHPTSPSPTLSQDEPGFAEMLVLVGNNDKTVVQASPILSPAEQKLIEDVLGLSEEVPWRVVSGGGWERHFARSDEVPSGLNSNSHPHFTVVVSQDTVELRAAKTKIIVHYQTNKNAIRSRLVEDLRRREGPLIWKAEKKMVERTGTGRFPWSDSEKRELLAKSQVAGYVVEMTSSSVLPSVHLWSFVKQGVKSGA